VDKARRPKLIAGYRWLPQSPIMIRLYIITFLQALGRMIIMPIAALFIMQLMGTKVGVATVTGIMMGAMAVTSSASGALMGRMGDRIGHGRDCWRRCWRPRWPYGSGCEVFFWPQPAYTLQRQ
jgi:MFS family permease